jgi:hypothetical protein
MFDKITSVMYSMKLGRYVSWETLRWLHFYCIKISREDLSSEQTLLRSYVMHIYLSL